MQASIRTDASVRVGAGHVMRCLTLANELASRGAETSFICRDVEGNLNKLIEENGFRVFTLPSEVDFITDCRLTEEYIKDRSLLTDLLIIDHYDIDFEYESKLRGAAKKIMVIDDFPNKEHVCDIYLSQDYSMVRNTDLLPKDCMVLSGPDYILLRPQFQETRIKYKRQYGRLNRILVFMGGADSKNLTYKVLKAITKIRRYDFLVEIVVGRLNSYTTKIEELALKIPNSRLHLNVENMAELMAVSDLSVGAGGTTIWERCCMGLASIVIVLDENQLETAKHLADNKAVVNLGWYEDVDEKDIRDAIESLMDNSVRIKEIGINGSKIIDGKGAERVVSKIYSHIN